ncbi:MAG TPA: hypothetical protein PKA74_12580, partial [Bauldia sp.]|nr:hypothetical protein [Bauldia sp.]
VGFDSPSGGSTPTISASMTSVTPSSAGSTGRDCHGSHGAGSIAVVGASPFGDVVAYQSHTPGIGDSGDIDAMALWSGQGVGLLRRTPAAGDIVREIADEARGVLARLGTDPGF